MNDQHVELLTELKRQKNLNRQSGKDKYDTTKQNVKKDKKDEDVVHVEHIYCSGPR